MIINDNSRIYAVNGISESEKQRIHDFLQGAVYCWCKNRKEEWFAVRTLMGGDNFYWDGTPLKPLFDKYTAQGKTPTQAIDAAGKDCGKLLKQVVANDRRSFRTKTEALTRQYLWVGNEI